MDEQIRAELRAIFRDEVADRLEVIEAQRAVIASATAAEAEVRAAVEEIYRAAHTLKGAAQAVGEAAIIRSCHGLEDTLGAARRSSALDRAALDRAVELTVRELRAFDAGSVAGRAEPVDSEVVSAEPVDSGAEVGSHEGLGAAGESSGSSEPSARHGLGHEVAVGSGSPTTEIEPEAESGATSIVGSAPASGAAGGTVRVELANVKLLARALQELTTMLGSADDRMEEREIAAITTRLGHKLREVRTMLGTSTELVELHESLTEIFEALGALRRTLTLRRLQRGHVQAAASRRLQQVDEVMRRLRLTTGRSLRLTLEQVAREAARELGKALTFECTGEDVAVDREVLDRVREPLSHLVRNAVDHGIESPEQRRARGKPERARVRLSVRADGAEVVFTLSDDGAGFDVEALARAAGEVEPTSGGGAEASLQYAFAPGVSTRDYATTTSGRGMGLAIVRDSIAALHGTIDVRTDAGRGTTIELRVPIHLNAVSGLVVDIEGTEFTIPVTAVDRIVRPGPDDVRVVEGGTWLREPAGTLLPAVLLPSGAGKVPIPRERTTCVVLGRGRQRVALWVEAVRDTRMLLMRPLPPRAVGSPCVRAATIQTDGAVGLVLDVASILQEARPAPAGPEQEASEISPATILVVDDSITTRQLVRVVLESAGYGVVLAEDGEIAWRKLRHEGPFDLVVSDVDMPHLDGMGLLARMRATTALREVPVILVTALEQEEDRRRALDMGADAYVGKSSFDQTSLLERIRDLLA